VTSDKVCTALDVSPPLANALIREFVQLGILQEVTGQQRGRVFVFQRYLSRYLSLFVI